MTNEQLAEFIQQGGNDELMPLLWDKNKKVIYIKCNKFWLFYSKKLEQHGYSFDDLYQEGYNALIYAVKQYNGNKGYKLITYLNYAYRYIIRGLLKHGSDVLNQSGTRSLEQPIAENEAGEQLLVEDTVQDMRAVKAFDEIERLDEYKALYEAVDSLPDEQREIIIEHYFKGLTYQQIGELHGFTLDRVRHRHSRALISLGSGEIGARLREIYGADYGMYDYIRHKGLKAFRSSGTSEIEDYVLRRLRNR